MKRMGLYIHVPFRIYKHNLRGTLSFCNMDFNINSYFKYLIKELEIRRNEDILIDSIYIGGGDPSSMNSDFIADIMEYIYANYNVEEGCEKTIELDPLVPDFRVKNFIRIGINRFSIKVFTFDKKGLEYLDLNHDKNNVIDLVKYLRKNGITNINLDMYYAYPGQSIKSLEEDFRIIDKLDIPHVSFYTFRNNEHIDTIYHTKDEIEISDELEEDMLDAISYVMEKQGYFHYEINHFAKKDSMSYHNQKYWNLYDYIGVGLGASGLIGNLLYKNECTFENYFEKIDLNNVPNKMEEYLTKEDFEKNYIISKMGMNEGINLDYVNKKFNINFLEKYNNIVQKYIDEGIVEIIDGRLRFTSKGIYLANRFYVEII